MSGEVLPTRDAYLAQRGRRRIRIRTALSRVWLPIFFAGLAGYRIGAAAWGEPVDWIDWAFVVVLIVAAFAWAVLVEQRTR